VPVGVFYCLKMQVQSTNGREILIMIDKKLAQQPIDIQMQAGHNIINLKLRRGEKREKRNLVYVNPNVIGEKTKVDTDRSQNNAAMVTLYSKENLARSLRRIQKEEQVKELRMLAKEGNEKRLALMQHDMLDKLKALGEMFPNFVEAVDYYRQSLLLLSLASESLPIWFPPMLLVGPPGVGKTRFLSELAKRVNTGVYSVDMSTITTGAVLSGGSSQWADSKPGFVTNSLRDSEVANPIILIDEVDKASTDARYNPISSLYSLLEKHTATRFVDEYLEVSMDCSHINWVASANDEFQIPEPIRSRMEVFHIKPPSASNSEVITVNIFRELLADESMWGNYFNSTLSDDVLASLQGVVPREIRKTLRKACGHAVERLGRESMPFTLSVDDIHFPQQVMRRSVGFI